MRLRHRGATSRSERGQTMVEFAVVLPILVLLLFGVIQFGILFNNYITLTDAVRRGARTAAVSRHESSPCTTAVDSAKEAAADLDQAALNVTCSSSWTPGTDVTITGTYPYDVSLLGFVVASGNLTSTTKERVE